jgi:hypothetical protein
VSGCAASTSQHWRWRRSWRTKTRRCRCVCGVSACCPPPSPPTPHLSHRVDSHTVRCSACAVTVSPSACVGVAGAARGRQRRLDAIEDAGTVEALLLRVHAMEEAEAEAARAAATALEVCAVGCPYVPSCSRTQAQAGRRRARTRTNTVALARTRSHTRRHWRGPGTHAHSLTHAPARV